MKGPVIKSRADVDAFINLIWVACGDPAVHAQLEELLSLPPHQRHEVIHNVVSNLQESAAPADLVAALEWLANDEIAAEAFHVIRQPRPITPSC